MEVFLEILKVTLPALIVFATVYFLFKSYLDGQLQLKNMELRAQNRGGAQPYKLQALERMTLLCERISLPSLLLRLNSQEGTAAGLRLGLLLAIQQEWEHNLTQQLYVSDPLWKILETAKNAVVNTVSTVSEEIGPEATAGQLSQALLRVSASGPQPLESAKMAIKKEASLSL